VLGAATALWLGRLLGSLLFDVRPTDPIALIAAAGVFGIFALGACLIPAYRASKVDLMQSLRQE
jgi:ABC-type antimicrobial peptide transport system permease subunit